MDFASLLRPDWHASKKTPQSAWYMENLPTMQQTEIMEEKPHFHTTMQNTGQGSTWGLIWMHENLTKINKVKNPFNILLICGVLTRILSDVSFVQHESMEPKNPQT